MQEAKDGRQERGQATRQKLVDAAIELFEKKGYNGVTVDDICRKAGVSKGAFYGHFESKDQALLEEYLKVDEFYREMLPRVLEEKTFVDRGIAYVRLALRYIAGQGKMVIKVAYSSQIAPGSKASPIASTDRALYTIAEAMAREALRGRGAPPGPGPGRGGADDHPLRPGPGIRLVPAGRPVRPGGGRRDAGHGAGGGPAPPLNNCHCEERSDEAIFVITRYFCILEPL